MPNAFLDEVLDEARDGVKSKSSSDKCIAGCRTRLVGRVPILGWRCSLGGADKGGGGLGRRDGLLERRLEARTILSRVSRINTKLAV